MIGLDHVALVGFRVQAAPALLDLGELATQHHMQSLLRHGMADRVADIVVEAAERLLAAVDERDPASEAVKDVRELEGDVAAARDQDSSRKFIEMERLVRGDA